MKLAPTLESNKYLAKQLYPLIVMLWQKKADTKNKSIQVALKCLQIE
jgi:hypothetical protein